MNTNETNFKQMCSIVNNTIEEYTKLRKAIDWNDEGKSASILRLAKPFQTGYFTIAVAGKTSAGKSTFINSLIGESILPTGHFQTTSGITWIVSSKERKLEVIFANGQKESYTENIPQKLKELVAVPEEFNKLPINHINTLIKGNDDINEILKKKEGVEEMTDSSSNDELWRAYVKAMPKSKIAEKIVIYLPLPKEYEGWRIIDTPGIGAVGGIQDATRELFTERGEDKSHIVDAVILLHSGLENIEDESANKFANDIKKSMGNLAAGRLFFVITHAAENKFTDNKEETLSRANNLYIDRLGIDKDRITYVDSFIHRYYCRLKKSGRDFSNEASLYEPLPGWKTEEWKDLAEKMFKIRMDLCMKKKEISNSTIFKELEELSNFSTLQKMLNSFLNNEKVDTFNKLINLIKEDLDALKETLEKDRKTVKKGAEEIKKQKDEITKEKTKLDIALGIAQKKLSKDSIGNIFGFVDVELSQLGQLGSIAEVRTKYHEIIDRGLNEEKQLFENIKSDFKESLNKVNNQSITFKTIDFDEIEHQASEAATVEETDYSRSEEKRTIEGTFSPKEKIVKTYPYSKKREDSEKKLREFSALVIKKGRAICEDFKSNIIAKGYCFYRIIAESGERKRDAAISRLNYYEKNINEKEKIIEHLEAKLKIIKETESLITELTKKNQ